MLFYKEKNELVLKEGEGGFSPGAPEGETPEGEIPEAPIGPDDNPADDPDEDAEEPDMGEDTLEGGIGEEPGKPVTDIEAQKKVTLFGEFEELNYTTDELANVIKQFMINTELDKTSNELFSAMSTTLADSTEKLRNIMVNQFSVMDYKSLVYLYLTLKTTVLTVSDLADKTVRNKS